MTNKNSNIPKNTRNITMKKITIKIPKLKQRVIWDFKPTTRIKPSKKLYNRKKSKNEIL
jgi:hypothetical protein